MTEAARAWPAPAKLNLFLHVLGRRPDGYHELETVFQLLDFGDSVHLSPRDDGRIVRVEGPPDIDPETDLCVRAARLLQERTGTRAGVAIGLDKRIPVGGGMGGGSSDAATTLRALDRIWGLDLGVEALAALGLELGADVPVFVRGHSAYARGVGETLAAIPLPERWYVVLDPGVHVATGPLFQAPDLTRNSATVTIPRFFAGDPTRNDFEPVVHARHPAVAEASRWLAQFAPARLTGTGGCVFAAFVDEADARRVAGLAPAGVRAWVARGVNRSGLLDALDLQGLQVAGAR